MIVYHYTKRFHLESILSEGHIKLDNGDQNIPSAVWLTKSEFVPNTARPINLKSGIYSDDIAGGYIRFKFEVDDTNIKWWPKFKKSLPGGRALASFEKEAARQGDNSREWYVSQVPLCIRDFEPAHLKPNARAFL